MIIRGEKVFLRPVHPADFPKLVAWSNDPDVSKYLEGEYPNSLDECPGWHQKAESNRHNQRFAISTIDGTLIGDVELDHIAWRSGDAELRIRIGEKDYWDQGYGTDTVHSLLRHAFRHMNLKRVYLRVYSTNKRAIRCYEKCGFRKEGRLRRPGPDGEPALVLLMTVLAQEYRARFELKPDQSRPA